MPSSFNAFNTNGLFKMTDERENDIDEKLEEIEKRCEAATKGPWFAINDPENDDPEYPDDRCLGIGTSLKPNPTSRWELDHKIVETDSGVYPPGISDAQFIANSRTDIPKLLKLVRLQREALELASGPMIADYPYDELIVISEQIDEVLNKKWDEV